MRLDIFKNALFLIIAITLCPASAFSDFYKWVDKNGQIHVTDNPSVIPPEYQNQVLQKKHTVENKTAAQIKKKQQRVIVLFEQAESGIIVDAVLNGKLTTVFHLDTGATFTMITKRDAALLGLKPNRRNKLKCRIADGRILRLPVVTLSSISVSGAEVKNIDVAVGNIRLLGMNYLDKFEVSINSKQGKLILNSRNIALKNTGSQDVSALYSKTGGEDEFVTTDMELLRERVETSIKLVEETIIKLKADINEKKIKLLENEAIVKKVGANRRRFNRSGISRNNVKTKKIKVHENNIARLTKYIDKQKKKLNLHEKKISSLRKKKNYFDQMITQ